MPKLSKSKRNKLKAESERKAIAKTKMGELYASHKEYICYHYDIGIGSHIKYDIFGDIKQRRVLSLEESPFIKYFHNHPWRVVNPNIETTSSGEFICRKCGQKFTKEEYKRLWEFFENKVSDRYNLPDGFEPVKYYYSAPNEITEV